ncbi:hypothetical protein BJV74DRAFT_962476, partial [Russula compacta]
MQFVFDYHTDLDHHGNVKGGKGKLSCVREVELAPPAVYSLVATPCCDIIEELRTLLRDFYRYTSIDTSLDPHAQLSYEAKRERDPRVKDARNKLSSSQWILDMINGHLASEWDVADDGSLLKTELRPDPSADRNRRKRKAPN